MNHYIGLNEWLGRKMFALVLLALVLGYLFPIPDSPRLHHVLLGLFCYMTFVTSLGTSFRHFLNVLNRPWIPLLALFLIHIVTPGLAWLVGTIFYPGDFYTRLGYLIGASIPVGVTSIIWTALTKGDMATSLVAVTLDTIIVPVFLPLYFTIVVGTFVSLNYFEMLLQMFVMITIPSTAAMIIHDLDIKPVAAFAKGIGGISSKVAFFLVIFINTSMVAPVITLSLPMLKMALVTLLIVVAGYAMGYLCSFVLKEPRRDIIFALIYTVGLRNIAFGVVLAVTFFPPQVAIPITLGMLFQQPIATIIPLLLKPKGQDTGTA